MRFASKKRAALLRERKRVTADMYGQPCEMPDCVQRVTEVHEVLTRARGGSITDRTNMRGLCSEHHRYITEHPAWAAENGWMRHAWEA